jgi:splicing factor 3B subunit 1
MDPLRLKELREEM